MKPPLRLFGLENPRGQVDRKWRRKLKQALKLVNETWPEETRQWDSIVGWSPVHRVYMEENSLVEEETELTQQWYTIAHHVLEGPQE